MCECVYVDCVECPAHVQCYYYSALWWHGSVEACCDGVTYVVYRCACRVVALEAMLRGDVWHVACDVWEQCLLQCFANTERSEMGLYEVTMFMSLFGFAIVMMIASFHA